MTATQRPSGRSAGSSNVQEGDSKWYQLLSLHQMHQQQQQQQDQLYQQHSAESQQSKDPACTSPTPTLYGATLSCHSNALPLL
jgi:hypothetical protein